MAAVDVPALELLRAIRDAGSVSAAASRTVADAVLPRWLARVSGRESTPTFSVTVMNSADVLEADSTDALVAGCIAGLGPAAVSRRSVTTELAVGSLTAVRIDGRLTRPFRAVWRSGERLSTVATSLLEQATKAAE